MGSLVTLISMNGSALSLSICRQSFCVGYDIGTTTI
jgi:hypothetical protein